MDTRERIYKFFAEQKRAEGLNYDTELLKSRFVNSLFFLQIVDYVEREFGLKLTRQDISKENFRTIDAIAALVDARLGRDV